MLNPVSRIIASCNSSSVRGACTFAVFWPRNSVIFFVRAASLTFSSLERPPIFARRTAISSALGGRLAAIVPACGADLPEVAVQRTTGTRGHPNNHLLRGSLVEQHPFHHARLAYTIWADIGIDVLLRRVDDREIKPDRLSEDRQQALVELL